MAEPQHLEKLGHCPACAAEIAELRAQLEAAELRLEVIDSALARHIRETPATPLEECDAVPATLPTDVTVPARKA